MLLLLFRKHKSFVNPKNIDEISIKGISDSFHKYDIICVQFFHKGGMA